MSNIGRNLQSSKLNQNANILFGILTGLFLFGMVSDIVADFRRHASLFHISADLVFGIFFIVAFFFILKKFQSREQAHTLEILESKKDLEVLKKNYETLVEGKLGAIQTQFTTWQLTPAEKDVALLLLKGLPVKQISSIRDASEKTVRHQCLSIYQKAAVEGRTELAAYFLEDIL